MKLDFANLQFQHNLYKEEIEEAILKVVNNCNFIMGDEINDLEKSLQDFIKVKYALSCSSGTDALLLALMALDIKPGDEVITTPFTFIATAETISLLGAIPVFVDIDEETYNINTSLIEERITSRTKLIIPVCLYGQPINIDEINRIASKYDLKVIIDGAQSFGATFNNITDSNFGDISITSFFPAKPLGCYGDGGAIFTNNKVLADKIKSLRIHGQVQRYKHKYIGLGARLDTIQAAVLNVKIKYYSKDLFLRQKVANKYSEKLKGNFDIVLPKINKKATSTWAQYSIRVKNRDLLQKKLKELMIPTSVHYPTPLHLQECFKYLGYKKGDFPVSEIVSTEIISLPMNPYLKDFEIDFICNNLLEEIKNVK